MSAAEDLATKLVTLPPSSLSCVVALASIGLAGFAVYAVWSIAKHKGRY